MSDPLLVIYGLVDPRSGQLRYIGQSRRGLRRASEHTHPSVLKKSTGHKGHWLRELSSQGMTPGVLLLEQVVDKKDLDNAEIWNIIYYRSLGNNLTNTTDGGGGVSGWFASSETRSKMSRSRKGKKRPDWIGKKVSATLTGKKNPKGSIARIAWCKAHPLTAEHKKILNESASRAVVDSDGVQHTSVNGALVVSGVPYRTMQRNLNINPIGNPQTLIKKYGLGFAYLSPKPK